MVSDGIRDVRLSSSIGHHHVWRDIRFCRNSRVMDYDVENDEGDMEIVKEGAS